LTDPDSRKNLGIAATIDRTASVQATRFGSHPEVGACTKIARRSFGNYAQVMSGIDTIHTNVGRFCSIAAHTRINPYNHRLDRVMINHVGCRSSAYDLYEDDAAVLAWRTGTPACCGV